MLIPTSQNVRTISDMRENALQLLKDIQKTGPTYIFHRSKPRGVILSIEEFLKLQEVIEDYQDELLAIRLERQLKKTPKKDLIPFSKLAKKYGIKV